MDTQNQNQNPGWFERNKWFILTIAIILLLLWKNFHAEFGFSELSTNKKDTTAIINAIKNSSDRIIDASNKNGDNLGKKIDRITDTLSAMKKCISCPPEPNPCPPVVKPKPKKTPCPPVVKPKPQPKPCPPVIKITPCPYDVIIDGEKYIYYNGIVPDSDNEKRGMKLKAGPKGSKDEGRWFVPGERVY